MSVEAILLGVAQDAGVPQDGRVVAREGLFIIVLAVGGVQVGRGDDPIATFLTVLALDDSTSSGSAGLLKVTVVSSVMILFR
jgi:hypothetical protein